MITGFHAVYEDDYYSAIDNADKYGFQFVQYDIGVPGFDPIHLTDDEIIKLREYARDKKIALCFHAPADYLSFFTNQNHVREGILEYYKVLLPKLELLKARHITIHTGDYSRFKMSEESGNEFIRRHGRYFSDILFENIMSLLSFRKNVMICVENCGFDGYIIKSLDRILTATKDIKLTLDTAKAYNANKTLNNEVFDFMLKNISRVREVHIHDWNDQFRSHQTVGSGFVDFSLFKDFYHKDDVYINYEVRPLKEAIKSKEAFERKYC